MSWLLLHLLPKLLPEMPVDLTTEVFAAFGALLLGFVLLRQTTAGKRGRKVQGEKTCTQDVEQEHSAPSTPSRIENLTELPKELQAKVFGFTGVEGLLQLSSTSTELHSELQKSEMLWKHFIAESDLPMPETPEVSSSPMAAAALHDHVRVKTLGIDNEDATWRSSADAATAAAVNHTQMLEDAIRVCSGLQKRDGQELVQKNLGAVVDLLRTYDVTSDDARANAERLVKTVVRRGQDLFQATEVSEAMNAFTESFELYEMLNNTNDNDDDQDQVQIEASEEDDYGITMHYSPTSLEDCIEAEYEESRGEFLAQGEAVDRLVDKLREILDLDEDGAEEEPMMTMSQAPLDAGFENTALLVTDI